MTPFKTFTISVVSHGHGAQAERLLAAIGAWSSSALQKVVLTVNAPALDAGFFDYPAGSFAFDLCIINNSKPRGFGANHNRAFEECSSDCFFVLNPDLDLPTNPFPELLSALANSRAGCAYPIQIALDGTRQDFERTLPTPAAVIKRRFASAGKKLKAGVQPQWVSGAFMAFNAAVFRSIRGFDEHYFMYCEDVDICLRLQLAGFELAHADATVVHHAHRQTTKNLSHLAWHVQSLLRLWNSPVYKAYRSKFLPSRPETM